MDWDQVFEELAVESRAASIVAEARIASHPVKRAKVENINFDHGDFGWLADPVAGDVDWDGIGDEEPTDEECEAAFDYWNTCGAEEHAREYAEGLGDYLLHRMREDY